MILHVSPDKGKSFERAHYPYQLSERSYRVVDSKEDSVFVQVLTDRLLFRRLDGVSVRIRHLESWQEPGRTRLASFDRLSQS